MSKLSYDDAVSHFEQSLDYQKAFEAYIDTELWKCENCETIYEEKSDLSEGGCDECYEIKNRGDNDNVR